MSVESLVGMMQADIAEPSAVTQSSEPPVVEQAPPVESEVTSAPTAVETAAEETTETDSSTEDEFNLSLDDEPKDQEDPVAKEAEEDKPLSKEELDNEMGKFLSLPRGKMIYASYKADRELAKPPEDGGIGFVPTVDQTKEYYTSHTDKQAMEYYFDSGEPEKAGEFISYWFGADENGAARPGAAQVAAQLAEVLPKVNIEAYTAMAQPAIKRFIDGLYRNAAADSDPEVRESLLNTAKMAEWWLTGGRNGGRYRDQATGQAQQPNQGGPSPEALELQKLRQQMEHQKKAEFTQKWNSFTSKVDADVDKHIRYDAEKALERLKGDLKPAFFNALVNDLVRETKESIDKNSEGLRQFNIRRDRSQRTMSDTDTRELVRMKRQLAQTAIMAKRTKYLADASATAKAQSDKRHEQLANSSSKTAPSANAVPLRRDIAAAMKKEPGETQMSYMRRLIEHGAEPA